MPSRTGHSGCSGILARLTLRRVGGELFAANPTGRYMPPRVLALAALGFILLILLLWPPRAGAGTYDVYSCRLPDGTLVPADGWRTVDTRMADDRLYALSDKCLAGQGLGASPLPIFTP